MSKGSKRRRENTALVEANWPFPDRRVNGPARTPVPDSQMAEAQVEAASQGAAVQDVRPAGPNHSSHGC